MTPDIQELKRRTLAKKQEGRNVTFARPDTILALIEENERLREALTTIGHSLVCAPTDYAEHNASELLKAGNIARAALKETTDG